MGNLLGFPKIKECRRSIKIENDACAGHFVVTHRAPVSRDAHHTAAKLAMAWQMAQIASAP
jgi:hypothetical protein